MSDLSTIVAAIETNLASITGLRTFDVFQGQVPTPAAVIELPDRIDYDQTFASATDGWTINVVVLVSRASERGGRKKLIDYLDGAGATSVKTAIESDVTLGGAAKTTMVREAKQIGRYTIDGVEYLGATFVCLVYA
jgi:hypothetical protein